MTRMSAFSSPLLLGFEEIERALDRLSKAAGDGYPPYNIERLARTADRAETCASRLPSPGFASDELDVVVEENELVIRGRQKEEPAREYLHRGIAARQFQKTFVLAEGIEVTGADLADGLLSIDLVRPESERVAQRIEINGRGVRRSNVMNTEKNPMSNEVFAGLGGGRIAYVRSLKARRGAEVLPVDAAGRSRPRTVGAASPPTARRSCSPTAARPSIMNAHEERAGDDEPALGQAGPRRAALAQAALCVAPSVSTA